VSIVAKLQRAACRLFGHRWDTHIWASRCDPYATTRQRKRLARVCSLCGLRERWEGYEPVA
jgi:hypothetical protein